MSYENPDAVPVEQIDPFIYINTSDAVRELELQLSLRGLRIEHINYSKNEYCGDRTVTKCTCPHWFRLKLVNLHTRTYEPNVWVFVCKRKRVWEIRYEGFVEDDFWINTGTRTQVAGHYIHSYSIPQVAEDIQIIYQAAEIKQYRSKDHDKYYSAMFRRMASQLKGS